MRNLFYLTKKKIQPVNIEPMFLEYKELICIDKTGFLTYKWYEGRNRQLAEESKCQIRGKKGFTSLAIKEM